MGFIFFIHISLKEHPDYYIIYEILGKLMISLAQLNCFDSYLKPHFMTFAVCTLEIHNLKIVLS